MSASHDSSASGAPAAAVVPASTASVPSTPLAQISSLGSNNQGWLQELQRLGFMPNTGTWQPAPPSVQKPMNAIGGPSTLMGAMLSGGTQGDGQSTGPNYFGGSN
jgi:hypothetical protein